MRRTTYQFDPVKIHRVKKTSLAISLEIDGANNTIIRFYAVDDAELTYKRIGIRTVSTPLYGVLKEHQSAIAKLINNFIDIHPKYEYLLKG